jgi:hypothetical protein
MVHRQEAMGWWNNLSPSSKQQICDTNTGLVGGVRKWESLTGHEIEKIYSESRISAYKVAVIESEVGWGVKIDDHMVCLSVEDALNFKEEFNSDNNSPTVPDWYMYAEGQPIPVYLNQEQYNLLVENKRMWWSSLKNTRDEKLETGKITER